MHRYHDELERSQGTYVMTITSPCHTKDSFVENATRAHHSYHADDLIVLFHEHVPLP